MLGYEAHLVDERAKGLGGFGTELRPVQLFAQALDSFAVQIRSFG